MSEIPINKIICGEVLEVLKTLPNESVDMVMTSPPYYGLRDYKVDKQIGLETTPAEYLQKLWAIFDEIKRVLKKDGTCFVNIGDTYAGSNQGYGQKQKSKTGFQFIGTGQYAASQDKPPQSKWSKWRRDELGYKTGCAIPPELKFAGMKAKCMVMMPERFALGMVERGWILRNRICWFKRNAMPSSVKDRFTCTYEYVYFFVKSRRYYFDLDSVRIPHKEVSKKRILRAVSNKYKYINNKNYGGGGGINKSRPNRNTKIPITTAELYESPRARYHREQNMAISQYQYGEGDYLVVNLNKKGRNPGDHWDITTKGYKEAHFAVYPERLCEMPIKAGCPKDGLVLDCFMGAGTTGVVAKKLGRNYLGVELNPEYIKLAQNRIDNIIKPML